MTHNDEDRTYDDLFDREDPEDTEYGTTQRRDSGNWAYVTREEDPFGSEYGSLEPTKEFDLSSESDSSPEHCPGGPTPDEDFSFEITNLRGTDTEFNFIPKYYPERFNVKRPRETKGNADSCRNESITLKYVKNSRIHAKGITLRERQNGLVAFQKLQNLIESKVYILNSLLPDGGLECYIEDAQYGEWEGYDPVSKDWLISWKVDLISLGPDGEREMKGVVSEMGSGDEGNIDVEDIDYEYLETVD